MSKWSKMTDAEKKAYYAARKARRAAKAKAKKSETRKPAPVAPKNAEITPKKCSGAKKRKSVKIVARKAAPVPSAVPAKEASVAEQMALLFAKRVTDERIAVENVVCVIGKALLHIVRKFIPETTFLKFEVDENGKLCAYYGGDAKKTPAKK